MKLNCVAVAFKISFSLENIHNLYRFVFIFYITSKIVIYLHPVKIINQLDGRAHSVLPNMLNLSYLNYSFRERDQLYLKPKYTIFLIFSFTKGRIIVYT